MIPVSKFTEKNKKKFEKILYQIEKKYDSSARTLSLNILFEMRPNKFESLVDFLNSNYSQFEVKKYLIQKLRLVAKKCNCFKDLLKDKLQIKKLLTNKD